MLHDEMFQVCCHVLKFSSYKHDYVKICDVQVSCQVIWSWYMSLKQTSDNQVKSCVVPPVLLVSTQGY